MISRIKSTLFSFYEKVLPFLETKKQKLSDFLNLPRVKLLRNNLLVGSLLLVITKLLFSDYLGFKLRLGLLLLFTALSYLLNLRERIKVPVAKILSLLLGDKFIHPSLADLEKYDFFEDDYHYLSCEFEIPKNNLFYYATLIGFEILWILRIIFQYIYISINGMRFVFDKYIYIYITGYYILLFFVIYQNHAVVLTYLNLFLIISKLSVYLSENSFPEVIYKMTKETETDVKRVKITKQNIMIFTFWNIRDLITISQKGKIEFSYLLAYFFILNSDSKYKYLENWEKKKYGIIPLDYKSS